MTIMLSTVIIVCISNSVFSQTYNESIVNRDDFVDNIFDMESYSSVYLSSSSNISTFNWYYSKRDVQNIGKTSVKITTGFYSCILRPLKKVRLPFFHTRNIEIEALYGLNRAIVYSSVYTKSCTPNIKDIQKDLDKINVVKKTFTVGVKNIPKYHLNLGTLISYFWPKNGANNTNIWQQLFEVVEGFLSVSHENVSTFIEEDIKDIHMEMITLTNSNVTDISDKFCSLDEKLRSFEKLLSMGKYDYFWVFPFYTNIIKLHLYFSALGIANPEIYQHRSTIDLLKVANKRFCQACAIIKYMQIKEIDYIYNTAYAAGLFNVLMNAYNYIAFHGLQLFSIWEELSEYLEISECELKCREPISYSNLYGKATPDLLKQAIHIVESPLAAYCEQNGRKAAKLNSIVVYIRSENQLKTVYGLSLIFSSNFSATMGSVGASQTPEIIDKQELSFANSTIIKLKVYRSVFIKCLEFTWANGTNTIVGNNCGNEFGVFELKDHYINSLYLANDYPKTEKYFDNIAVSFIPYSL